VPASRHRGRRRNHHLRQIAHEVIADVKLAGPPNDVLKSEALLSQLQKMGYEPLGGTAADFTRYVDSELRKWTAAAQAAGVRK
jgi:tripartite-type tricarboxylate transporter receptor subunit TctC